MKVFTEGNVQIELPEDARFDGAGQPGGYGMKKVDFIAKLDDESFFIEVKKNLNALGGGNVVQKFRDSFLHEWAQRHHHGRVFYLVLVGSEESTADLAYKTSWLQQELPEIGPWKRQLVAGCAVMDIRAWNKWIPKFHAWPNE